MGLFNKKSDGNSTESLIYRFITKSEGLQRILEKETEYFRDMKVKQAELLVESKLALIEDIESIKLSLVSNPSVLKNLPATEKQKIRMANDGLMKAAEDNYNETVKAKEVNKLILEAISEAVAQSKRVDGAYGENGNSYYDSNSLSASPLALLKTV